jgi:NADPH:quinone reductase-like Zn-dependent oxidoreductase
MATSNSLAGNANSARALFYDTPGFASIRTVMNTILIEDDRAKANVLIRTLYSGLSRGTERLVFEGRLPESEWARMRAPFQEGDFPFPVKYGYAAAGVVEAGPDALVGSRIFALYPHQDFFTISAESVIPLPENLPPRRAVLAANMETALNALWDSRAQAGHKIVIIGAGLVGCLIAHLAARLPGTDVTLVDVIPERVEVAQSLGINFSLPGDAPLGAEIIFHTSASEAGLRLALDIAGFEGRIIEVSWFGDKSASLPLGGAFHSQRLQLISTQVGHVAVPMRGCMTHRQRLEKALHLLDDDRLDALITDEVAFDDLPDALPRLLAPDALGIATAICY